MAKPSCLLLFLGLGLCVPAFAQYTPAVPMIFVTVDPSGACGLNVPLRYNTSNGKLWGCDSGTWAQISGGGGGTAPGGTTGAIQYNNAAAFGGDVSVFDYNAIALTTPSAPVLTRVGAAGTTSWGYKIVGANGIGHTAASAETLLTTGNSVLDGTHSITVATAVVSGSTSCDVWRTTAGGTPSGTGYIGTVTCGLSLSDTGLTSFWRFGPPPADSTTGYYSGVRSTLNNYIEQTDFNGDNGNPYNLAWSAYFGSPYTSFTSNLSRLDLGTGKYVFSHYGTTDWVINNVISTIESTDGAGQIAIGAYAASQGGVNSDNVYGTYSEASSTGPAANGVLPAAEANAGKVRALSTGDIARGSVFAAHGGDGSHTPGNGDLQLQTGFYCYDLTGGDTNACLYSDVNAASGAYAIYTNGTAASFLGGTLQTVGAVTTPSVQVGGLTGPAWTTGAGTPSNPCVNGSLYTNTTGTAGSTLYSCVSASWLAFALH